jgi:hypothetical protein
MVDGHRPRDTTGTAASRRSANGNPRETGSWWTFRPRANGAAGSVGITRISGSVTCLPPGVDFSFRRGQ